MRVQGKERGRRQEEGRKKRDEATQRALGDEGRGDRGSREGGGEMVLPRKGVG